MEVLLGNVAPVKPGKQRVVGPLPKGAQWVATRVRFIDAVTVEEAIVGMIAPAGTWHQHSDKAAVWVASDVPALAEALRDYFQSGPHDGHTVEVLSWDAALARAAAG